MEEKGEHLPHLHILLYQFIDEETEAKVVQCPVQGHRAIKQ